jgi:hypothetical protein
VSTRRERSRNRTRRKTRRAIAVVARHVGEMLTAQLSRGSPLIRMLRFEPKPAEDHE